MNKQAYDQGVAVALGHFKLSAMSPHLSNALFGAGMLTPAAVINGIRAARDAPEGQRRGAGLSTAAGTIAGGALGSMAGGALSGPLANLGISPFLTYMLGTGAGASIGAIKANKAHASWAGKDKPGPKSPGEKTESQEKKEPADDAE